MSLSVSAATRNPAGELLHKLIEGTPIAQKMQPMPDLSASNEVQATQAAVLELSTIRAAITGLESMENIQEMGTMSTGLDIRV